MLFDKGPEGVLGKVNAFIQSYKVSHGEYASRFPNPGLPAPFTGCTRISSRPWTPLSPRPSRRRSSALSWIWKSGSKTGWKKHAATFEDLVADALARYVRVLADHGITGVAPETPPPFGSLNMGAVKSEAGIRLPTVTAVLRYTARIKTEAVFRFGFYKLVRKATDLIKRRVSTAKTEQERALADAVDLMRKNMGQAVAFNFKDFRENVKFQYLFKMADAAAQNMLQRLEERFAAYGADLSDTVFAVDQTRSEKNRITEELEKIVAGCGQVHREIRRIKEMVTA